MDMEQLLENQPFINSNPDEWEVIVKYSGDLSRLEADLGFRAELLGNSYAILTMQSPQISRLLKYKEIEYIELPKKLVLSVRQSLSATCIEPVQRVGEYNLKGKGVAIGIIDSGIDYTHPDFRDNDGKSRILFLWDQQGVGNPPSGFLSGAEYTKSDLDAALESQHPLSVIPMMDYIGHGTAVAGIAAGNGRASGGNERGVAPEASIIVVKLGERGRRSFARTTEIMRALKYISDRAAELMMPLAINLSFGTNNGSHAGNSLFETYIDAVSGRWKSVIVTATGNEGYAGHHFGGFAQFGNTIEASFFVATNLNSMYLTLWKNFVDTFDLELVAPGGRSTGKLNPAEPLRKMDLQGTNVEVHYGQPSIYNEKQEVFIQFERQPQYIHKGIWRLYITGRQVIDGEFHIWLPTVEEVGIDTAFAVPDPYLTLTLPSTAERVVSVGGYNGRVGSAADFSGRGYTFHRVFVKPDLVAPAVNILSTKAGGGYDSYTGTSMAAPFVAGAAALMMEWGVVRGNDPFLYGQRVKAFLQKTASRDSMRNYPNPIWGYGTLCLKAAMDALSEYTAFTLR